MSDKTYNGWTNYETWRVNLEMFDNWATDGEKVSADRLEDFARDYIIDETEGKYVSLTRDWALAFISNVNWHEIAEHINEANEEG